MESADFVSDKYGYRGEPKQNRHSGRFCSGFI